MKAAVITMHSVCNYGTQLQAYATQEKLKQYFDEVEFIDYRREDTYGIGLLKRKTPVAMTGAFFLGICINYPNGLFNSSLFQV